MNGEAITSRMEGCPPDADLCDVQVLLDRVTPFATADRDCDARHWKHEAIKESKVLLSTAGGVTLVLFVTIACGLLGSFVTYYYLTRRLPCRKKPSYDMAISNGRIPTYHDDVDDFRDEPDVDDGNVELNTVAALVE